MRVTIPNLKQALVGQLDKNNTIANNLANMNTLGYKRDFLFFDALDKKMASRNGEREAIDFSQGTLKQTANSLDVALSGPGFFTVENDDGQQFFTRVGHFKLDDDGILRTASGDMVMGEGGPITIIGKSLQPKNITITRNGEIYVDDAYMDRLQIVDFEDKSKLQKIGNNLFQAKNDAETVTVDKPELHQGFLEESNVNPADEMIQLIEVQRQFESVQRMVRTLDEVFQRAAGQVGKY